MALIVKMIVEIVICTLLQIAICRLPPTMQAGQGLINVALFSTVLCTAAFTLWRQSQRLIALGQKHAHARITDLQHVEFYLKAITVILVALFSISLPINLEIQVYAILSSFLAWSCAIFAGIRKATPDTKAKKS
ncbi:MAG: hypothetical protein Q4B77_05450 [Coriobacteriaceae bacterium]|nr:hypothetical protein [Coriobacteriaceae bacterium]